MCKYWIILLQFLCNLKPFAVLLLLAISRRSPKWRLSMACVYAEKSNSLSLGDNSKFILAILFMNATMSPYLLACYANSAWYVYIYVSLSPSAFTLTETIVCKQYIKLRTWNKNRAILFVCIMFRHHSESKHVSVITRYSVC
jgi:hypothetical protein